MKKILLLFIFEFLFLFESFAQQFPISPNAYDAKGKRAGHWTILYDSTFTKEVSAPDSAFYYRLMRFENGKPSGKARDFYRNGIKQWDGYLLSINPDVADGEVTYYFENGKVRYNFNRKNGKQDGFFKEFTVNGGLLTEGQNKNDSANGKWITYHPNGIKFIEAFYKNNQANGEVLVFYPTGKLNKRGFKINDQAEGWWEEYYESGKTKSRDFMKVGLINGVSENYFEEGQLESKGNKYNSNKIGSWQFYFDTGQVKKEGAYDSAGNRTGLWKSYFSNGGIQTKIEWLVDKFDGGYVEYFENGKIKTKATCTNNLWQGVFEEYFEDGQLKKKGSYKLDSMEGDWIFYHATGKINSVGSFIENKKNGVWKYYNEKGQLESEETLIMGKLNGATINYFASGQVSEKKEFVSGELNNRFDKYFENGKLESTGVYNFGKRNGYWLWYYSTGQLDSKEPYLNGEWHGPWIRYYANGNKKAEGTAQHDKKEGLQKYYYANGQLKNQGNCIQDNRTGRWVYYDSITGKKQSEGEYINNNLNGKWKFYTRNGKMESTTFYINGFLENFDNVEDSLRTLSNLGLDKNANQALNWLENVRKRDFAKDKDKKNRMLFWKGFLASDQKEYQKALNYYAQYSAEVKRVMGDTAIGYVNGINNTAVVLERLGRTEESFQLFKKLEEGFLRINQEPSTTIIENVAYALGQLNQFEEEEQYLLQVIARQKKSSRSSPHSIFSLLNTLGSLYQDDLHEYEKALTIFKAIIKQADSLELTTDEFYGLAHYKIGVFYKLKDDRPKAIEWYKRAAVIQQKNFYRNPNYYLNTLNSLGNSYMGLEQFDSSFQVYTQMKEYVEKAGLENTLKYASALDGLAEVYYKKYESKEALNLWLHAKTIIEKLKATNSVEYIDVLQALSRIVSENDQTRIGEAEAYLLQAIEIENKMNGNSRKYRNFVLALGDFYTETNRYEKANNVLENDLKLIQSADGASSQMYAVCLMRLADNEYELSHYTNAIGYYQKALPIVEQNQKLGPADYIDVLSGLGNSYKHLNEPIKAEENLRLSLKSAQELLGKETLITADQMQTLAAFFSYQSLYADAEKLYREAGVIIKKLLGEKNLKYAYSIRNIAGVHKASENFKKALVEYQRYDILIQEIKGVQSIEQVMTLTNMALANEGLNNKAEAERLHRAALAMAATVYGKEDLEYAYKLKNVGLFYYSTEQYAQAEKYLEQASRLSLNIQGENSSEYANFLVELSKVKSSTDKFKDAEALLIKAVSINKENKADRLVSYIASLEQLQAFYNSFGRYQDASDQLDIILKLFEENAIENGRYIQSLLAKSSVFIGWEKYDSATAYSNKALMLAEELFAPNDWRILKAHNLLGISDSRQYKLETAEKHFKYCLEQQKISGLDKTSEQAVSINNLATVEMARKNYLEAEKLLNQARQLQEQLKDAPGISYNNLNKGKLYLAWGKPELAEKYFKEAVNSKKTAILNNFYFLSDNEKAQFWKAERYVIDYFQSFAVQRMKQNPLILQDLYNLQINTKGILLSSSNKIKKRILSSGDTVMVNHFYQWLTQRDRLAQFYALSKDELKLKKAKLDSLEVLAKASEKELNITSEDLEKDKGKETTWREVQKALATNEAAIELIRIKHHTTRPTDSTLYAIMILTTEMKNGPQAVVLPNGKLLEGRALKFYKNAIATQLVDSLSYRNYWAAIEPFVKNKTRLYLSLDGAYNSINLNTLMAPDGKFLVDSKNISIVANTKDIIYLKRGAQIFTKSNASLIGFPKYFMGKERLKSRGKQRDFDFDKLSDQDNSGIAELPGTLTEMEKVNEILSAHQWQVTTFANEEATEEAIKEIRQPGLLHIATHGFFTDEKDDVSSSDPMLRAGLLFTGAANYFQDKISISADNGVLTAYEASNLNLDNTELVILSACETGKGEVQNGEGVYGLQRAFQTAGAKSILMSLWKVDDTATQELMTLFYENWTSGKTKTDAFKAAQLSLKEKYSSPYYWGAFVMMGN